MLCILFSRLKLQMIDRVHEVAADFRKATNRAMADTTKRTIAENVAIESQLAKMADKSTDVLQENGSLQHQISARRRHVAQFEMAQNDLAKDYISGCKVATSSVYCNVLQQGRLRFYYF